MWWSEAWKWISDNNGALAFLLALGVAGSALYRFISIKRAEERARRFASYHELVEALNGNGAGGAPFIDRQIAVVYEMRNFPEYYPVTLRLLRRSLERWRKLKLDSTYSLITYSSQESQNTLADEARLTIRYIERKQAERSYLCIPDEDRL
ncbi:hypothetical protein D3C81_664140 [compost metagenome]